MKEREGRARKGLVSLQHHVLWIGTSVGGFGVCGYLASALAGCMVTLPTFFFPFLVCDGVGRGQDSLDWTGQGHLGWLAGWLAGWLVLLAWVRYLL